jgi:predicted nucleic acid-binding protein
MIAAKNSSPWIFLSGLGIIEDAISLFEELIVPQSVFEEIIQKHNMSAEMLLKLKKTRAFMVYQAENLPEKGDRIIENQLINNRSMEI